MADNTASSNAANTQAPTATGASTEKTTQVFNDAPAAHQNGLSGSEGVAKQIVDSSRAENAPLSQYQGLTAEDNADLNEITPAAGQPMGKSGAPMADMNMQSNVASGMAAHTLSKPAAGHTEVVHVSSGEMIATQFNPDDADLRMSGDDLILSFNDGSKIVLDGFAQDAQNLPTIALPNGALVAGGIIVAQLQGTQDEIFNLETAAGGAGRSNGGFFIYSDNMGDVIDLLNKLPPIPFTALQFAQPQPEVTVSDFDPAEGDFFPGFETIDGNIVIAGGFEDWQPHQNVGNYTESPMALNITFVPHDNEIVEQVTISNIPTGVLFFYKDSAGNVTPLTLTNGSITLTGDQLANGNVLVLPPTNSGKDIPMTISMTISDPNTENTAVITKNVVAVVDSVADLPTQLDTSTITLGAVTKSNGGTVSGNEVDNNNVNLALKVNFNDNDLSETHTVIIQGVPAQWTMINGSGLTFTTTTNPDGTITYTAKVTGNVNTTISFDPNEWSSAKNGGDAQIKVIARAEETTLDNELNLGNNTAQTEVKFGVHIEEDVPVVVTPGAGAPPAVVLEHSLDNGVANDEKVSGDIVVEFKSDGPGAITFSQDNKAALEAMGLKSGGKDLVYTVANGKITATTTTGEKVFEITLGAQTNADADGSQQKVTYTFTLFKPLDHVGGDGTNLNIPFKFTATDSDNDKVNGSFQIRVVDDVPTVANVERTIDETNGLNAVLTGSVNPNFHADGAGSVAGNNQFTASGSVTAGGLKSNGIPVTVTLVGDTYVGKAGNAEVFTLKINADGTYTFTQKAQLDHLDGSNPNDVINLNFGYTAKDFDGDTASATITVKVVDDAPVAVADTGLVPDGSNTASGNVISNDVLSKDAVNVLKDVTFSGTTKTFDGAPSDAGGKYVILTGTYGTLKIYENGTYTYTVNANNVGNHTEQFGYTLVDKDGDTSKTSLTFNIIDTGPGTPPAVSKTIDETTDINVSVGGTITVTNATQFVLGNPAGAATFTSGGSKAGGALTSNGNLVSVSIENGQYVGKTSNGTVVFTLSINNNGQYTFVQKAPLDHADGNDANDIINLNFTYTAKDADGDAVSNTITINVKDDAPVAVADTNNVPDGATTATGNVITNDTLSKDVVNLLKDASFGGTTKSFATPDGTDANGKFVVIAGQYGTLKIYENGTYTYTVNANNVGNHAEQFNYTLVDKDGDTSKTTLTLNIVDNGPGAPPAVSKTIDETTDINVSVGGTITVAGATQFALGNPAGAATFTSGGSQLGGSLKSNGQPVTVSIENGQYIGKTANGTVIFTLSINNNGQYTFIQKAPIDHANGSDPNDIINLNFTYTAKDADGDAVSNTITINVKDDAPIAVADTNNVPNGASTASGNVITNDVLSKDVVNLLKDASFGGTTKSFATPDGTDVNGKFVVIAGQYGSLKIYENGQYTYTLNPNNVGNHTEQFKYTLMDKDGDTSQTTLTLNIVDSGPGEAPCVINIVDETFDIGQAVSDTITVQGATQFALGNPAGAATFSSGGSLLGGSLKSNGVPITVSLVNGQYVGKAGNVEVFTLSINNNGQYTFTLKAPIDHADGTNPNDIINLNFTYTAKDADGDAVSNLITINVKDDAPLAVADVKSVPDGAVSVNGNVVTNDTLSKDVANILKDASFGATTKSFGTDSDAGGKYVILQGQYGTLKIYENGNYTYTVNAGNNGNHTEQFNYTLVDKDGDTSKTTLTLNIVDTGPGAPPAVSQTIDETTDINLSVGGTITVAGATQFVLGNQAGAATFTSGGSLAGGSLKSNGQPVTVSIENGQYVGKAGNTVVFTLSINNNGQYVFVQKAPIDHADGTNPNDIINLNFTYTAKDADGDAVSNTITINVKDDAPIAVADIGNVPNGSSTATGNVVSNDTLSKDVVNLLKDASFGGTTKSFANPDGSDANGKFVIVNGQYGTLKIYENGNYTYTVNAGNNGNHTEQFNYTLIDKDGDTSKTTLTLNIVDNGPGTAPLVEKTIDETTDINVSTGGTITVAGATQFVLGTVTGTPAFSSDGSKAGGALTSNGQPISVSLEGGQYVGKANGVVIFTLSINNNGQYTFVLKGPLDHADGANPNDVINLNFAYTAKDADGDAVENQIQIHVRDDAPLAVADIGNIPNGSSTATGNVISNDTLSKDVVNVLKDVSGKSFASPDGTEGGVKYVLVNGQYGQLKIFENGQYTYTLNANNVGNHTEQFNYTLVDKDGDTSKTTLTLNIVDNGPGAAPSVEKTIDETTDLNVSVGGTITVAGATQFALGTATGAGAFSAGGSLQTGSLKSNGVAVTVTLENGQYVGKAGGVEVFRLTINNNGTYSFVQKAPIDHADGNNANDIIDLNFTYTAKDADGDAVSNTITIHVKDDAPVAVADTNSLVDTNIAVGNVMTNDVMSKDVINTLKDVSFGGTTKSFDTDGLTDAGGKYVVVSGANGVLKMYDNGTYTYTLNGGTPQPGNGGTLNDQFKYTLQDKDGDISQTTLTLDATLPKLIVGENIDDKPGSSTPYEVGTGTGTITGGNASDILVGDVGGNTVTQQPKNYNIVLILDVSGSMAGNKIDLLKQAVNNLLQDLDSYQGGTVKVHLIPFSTSAGTGQTFDLSTPTGYQAAVNFVNGLNADGYTNFEAPLQSANQWYAANNTAGTTNFTYFVSDGDPNRTINANGVVTAVSAVQAMDEILGTDGSNEVATLQGYGEVVGVGIGVNQTTINRLNDIDSGTDSSLDVRNPDDLSKALQGANPINQLAAVGGDTLAGGNGHDIIFGDVLNTDKLAIAHNLLTPPGSGWMVFAELEANHGWSRTDTINYIRTHAEELGHETVTAQGPRSGGHDTITGGDGNDIIFGQEGNDTINGGNGNDVISGGSGNNTLTGGAGADTFLFLKDDTGHDTITDYSNAQNDKLDISDLLTGSTYQPGISHIEDFVKIDHTTGGVFVDATGHGNFGASNQIGTINNISSFDTINVILNDNEGTKIVHTS